MLQRPGNSSCSFQELCLTVAEDREQQLDLGVLQERCRSHEAVVAVSRSVTGALQRPANDCSVIERCQTAAVARKNGLQNLRALQELCRSQDAAVSALGSIAAALQR